MRISDWSSDVCSSDLATRQAGRKNRRRAYRDDARPSRCLLRLLAGATNFLKQRLDFHTLGFQCRLVDDQTRTDLTDDFGFDQTEIICQVRDRKSTRLNSSH